MSLRWWWFNRSVVSDCLWPHGLQHARLPCPSLSPGVCSDLCALGWWCYLNISSSAALFSFCFQMFPSIRAFFSESREHFSPLPIICYFFFFFLICYFLTHLLWAEWLVSVMMVSVCLPSDALATPTVLLGYLGFSYLGRGVISSGPPLLTLNVE